MNVTTGVMQALIPMAVWYTVTCSACDETCQMGRDVLEGSALPIMQIPWEWTILAGRAYCPKHEIRILVDGEKKFDKAPTETTNG
jgi:hypothetical protein